MHTECNVRSKDECYVLLLNLLMLSLLLKYLLQILSLLAQWFTLDGRFSRLAELQIQEIGHIWEMYEIQEIGFFQEVNYVWEIRYAWNSKIDLKIGYFS